MKALRYPESVFGFTFHEILVFIALKEDEKERRLFLKRIRLEERSYLKSNGFLPCFGRSGQVA